MSLISKTVVARTSLAVSIALLALPAFSASRVPDGSVLAAAPSNRSSIDMVRNQSVRDVLATIVIDNVAWAVVPETPPALIHLRNGVHRAFGVSGGLFAFTALDAEGYPNPQLHVLDLATGRETAVLPGEDAAQAAWRPGTAQISIRVRTEHDAKLVLYDLSSSKRVETVLQDPTSDVFRWSDRGDIFIITSELPDADPHSSKRARLIQRFDVNALLVSEEVADESLLAALASYRSVETHEEIVTTARRLAATVKSDESGAVTIERIGGSDVLTHAYPYWPVSDAATIVKTVTPTVAYYWVRLDLGTADLLARSTALAPPPVKLPWPKPQRKSVTGGNGGGHTGSSYWAYDFGLSGPRVLAADAGRVVYVKYDITCNYGDHPDCIPKCASKAAANGGWGNVVVLEHSNGWWTKYAHLAPYSVRVVYGQTVPVGAYLGDAGHTGISAGKNSPCGDHLHFQRQNGDGRDDPSVYVDFVEQEGITPRGDSIPEGTPLTSQNTDVCSGATGFSGTVTDVFEGTPIEGVSVTWGNCTDATDASGRYSFKSIPCLSATLTASKTGYQTSTEAYPVPTCVPGPVKNIELTPLMMCVAPSLDGVQTTAGCAKPTVRTDAATNITSSSATFNATVTSDGGSSILERRFEWGIYPAWTNATNLNGGTITVSGSSFSYSASGLKADTLYQFRAWARNAIGWAPVANSVTFTTEPAAPNVCTSFLIDPEFASPSAGASSRSVTVTGSSPDGCTGGTWSTSSNATWLSVTPASSTGNGNATVSWMVNPSPSARTGSVTVANRTFVATQSGTTASNCSSFSIDPTSASPSSSAGSRTVAVIGSPTGCQGGAWSTSDTSLWLDVSPATGTGPGSTRVSWQTSSQRSVRSDSVTIAGRMFSVIQSGNDANDREPHPFISVPGARRESHDMGVAPDGSIYVLLPTTDPKSLRVAKSADGGLSWNSPVTISDSSYSNSDYAMAVDATGAVHVVWALYGDDQAYYSRSLDGGASFSAPIGVRSGDTFDGYKTDSASVPVVVADGFGNVYVAYKARTLDSSGDFISFNVWVSKSENGGSSFESEFLINEVTVDDRYRPLELQATATNLYVLYLNEETDDLYFYRHNRGDTSGNTGRVNATQGEAGVDADFVVAPGETTFYAVYSDETDDYEGDILLCKSIDGGITWPVCARVNDSTRRSQRSPDLGLDRNGGLHATWIDGRYNGEPHMYYAFSDDGGATFSANLDMSAPLSDVRFSDPHLAIDEVRDAVIVSAGRDPDEVVVALLPIVPEPPSAPTGLSALAVASSRVDISWNAVPNASGYRIERQSSGDFVKDLGVVSTTSFSDTSVSSPKAYLYRVRAVSVGGISDTSDADLATTIVFTENPLTRGAVTKAAHITELRLAINAVRSLAGLTANAFTYPATAGTSIRAADVMELRSGLDAAFDALGFGTASYSDGTLSGAHIKAVHLQELRDRMR